MKYVKSLGTQIMTRELQNFQQEYKMKKHFTNNTCPLENGNV